MILRLEKFSIEEMFGNVRVAIFGLLLPLLWRTAEHRFSVHQQALQKIQVRIT